MHPKREFLLLVWLGFSPQSSIRLPAGGPHMAISGGIEEEGGKGEGWRERDGGRGRKGEGWRERDEGEG